MTSESKYGFEQITVLRDGLTLGNQVRNRGDVVRVTDELIESLTDRKGGSILNLVEDERAQVEMMGERFLVPGDVSQHIVRSDVAARGAAERKRQADAASRRSDDAMEALRSHWAEEDRAARTRLRTRSTTTRAKS